MGKCKVLIFPSAKEDLLDIVDYINELSPAAALKLYDEIVDTIGSLEQMPKRCPYAKNTILRAKGYRVLTVRKYLVFFVVTGSTVEVRRIIFGRRRYEFLL